MSRPLLSIAAELSAPPSSPSCFRDLTLVASVFKGYDIVALSPTDMLDPYHRWFKRYGLYDFLEDLLPEGSVSCNIQIVGGPGSSLTAHNLHDVLRLL